MDANEEFLKAFELIKVIVPEELEYRLHYNAAGEIYLCTMQQHPDNTQYIVVDRETYYRYFDYNIVDGKLKKIDRNPAYRVKLKKSDSGHSVVRHHAGIILEQNETYTDIEYYADN